MWEGVVVGCVEWGIVNPAWDRVCAIHKQRNISCPGIFHHPLQWWWCMSWLWMWIRCIRSYGPHNGNSASFFSPPTLVFILSPNSQTTAWCVGTIQTEEKRHLSDTCPWEEVQSVKQKSGAGSWKPRTAGGRPSDLEEESIHLGLRTYKCEFHLQSLIFYMASDKPLPLLISLSISFSFSFIFLNCKMSDQN